jgi:hypothetical protein
MSAAEELPQPVEEKLRENVGTTIGGLHQPTNKTAN